MAYILHLIARKEKVNYMKDIVIYGIVPDGKSTWRIVNEDRIFIVDIHDYDIEGICEGICVRDDIEKYSAEEFIKRVWEELRDFFSPEINNCTYCENGTSFVLGVMTKLWTTSQLNYQICINKDYLILSSLFSLRLPSG